MGKHSEPNQSNLSHSKSVGKNDAQVKKVVYDSADELLVDLSKYTESKINNMAKTELIQIMLSLGKISKRALDEMTNKQIREQLLALRKRQIEMKEKADDKYSYPTTQQSTQRRNPPHKSSRYDGIAFRDLTAGDYYYDNSHPSPVYDYGTTQNLQQGRILKSSQNCADVSTGSAYQHCTHLPTQVQNEHQAKSATRLYNTNSDDDIVICTRKEENERKEAENSLKVDLAVAKTRLEERESNEEKNKAAKEEDRIFIGQAMNQQTPQTIMLQEGFTKLLDRVTTGAPIIPSSPHNKSTLLPTGTTISPTVIVSRSNSIASSIQQGQLLHGESLPPVVQHIQHPSTQLLVQVPVLQQPAPEGVNVNPPNTTQVAQYHFFQPTIQHRNQPQQHYTNYQDQSQFQQQPQYQQGSSHQQYQQGPQHQQYQQYQQGPSHQQYQQGPQHQQYQQGPPHQQYQQGPSHQQ